MTIWDDSGPEREASFWFSGVFRFAMSALKLIFSVVSRAPFRKGVDAHMGIISSYMQGMDIKPEDRLIVCDILPNKPGHVKTHVM